MNLKLDKNLHLCLFLALVSTQTVDSFEVLVSGLALPHFPFLSYSPLASYSMLHRPFIHLDTLVVVGISSSLGLYCFAFIFPLHLLQGIKGSSVSLVECLEAAPLCLTL